MIQEKKKVLGQRAKRVVSDSPGLVDFAIGRVNSVVNFARRASDVFWAIWLTEELWNQFCLSKSVWG